jgi:hypothetical protein
MSLRAGAIGGSLLLAFHPGLASAQEPHGIEAGAEALVTLADPTFAGGGVSLGVRPGGSVRVVLNLLAGGQRERLAGRGELLGQLMLTPARRRGVGVYGVAGIAGQLGQRDAGWLVLGLGLEQAPAERSGWHLEAGIGGGVRLAAGWRHRWLSHARARAP